MTKQISYFNLYLGHMTRTRLILMRTATIYSYREKSLLSGFHTNRYYWVEKFLCNGRIVTLVLLIYVL